MLTQSVSDDDDGRAVGRSPSTSTPVRALASAVVRSFHTHPTRVRSVTDPTDHQCFREYKLFVYQCMYSHSFDSSLLRAFRGFSNQKKNCQ